MASATTQHAEQRVAQRSFKDEDLQLIYQFGAETTDGILLRERDIRGEVTRLKHKIDRLERLTGVYLVMNQDQAVTVYRPTGKRLKRRLRHCI